MRPDNVTCILFEIDEPAPDNQRERVFARARFMRHFATLYALGDVSVARNGIGAYTDLETGATSLAPCYLLEAKDFHRVDTWAGKQQSVLVWAGKGNGRAALAAPTGAAIAAAAALIESGGGAPMVASATMPVGAAGWTYDLDGQVFWTAAGDLPFVAER